MDHKDYKHISVCLDVKDLQKLREITQRECRSVSSQVRVWIGQCIREYERSNSGQEKPAGRSI